MTIFIIGIILFAELALLYSVRKVNKVQIDFRSKLQNTNNEKEKQIYTIFIKKYAVVKKVLLVCMLFIVVMAVVLIKILIPLY